MPCGMGSRDEDVLQRGVEAVVMIDAVYDYLRKNYKVNEPIFLEDINIPGVKEETVRQQMKELVEDGRIQRFDTGIYYISRKSMFRFGSMLSVDDVIRKKYLMEGDVCCGYLSGVLFANQIGLTTQVPMVYEIYTNKAESDYQATTIGNLRVIVRRPCVEVDDKNVSVLQFLDLMREVGDISELDGAELTDRLLKYMKANNMVFGTIKPFLSFYPDAVYRNMYKVGLLNGVAA